MNEINIVYGGAFNPPTLAHKQIILSMIEKFKPKNIIIVPTGNNYTYKHDLLPIKSRIEMLELMDLPDECIISDFEEHTTTYLGTYQTLEHFSKEYSNIYFAMGLDNLAYVSKWLNAKKLLSEYKFIVFTRKNYNMQEALVEQVDKEYHDNFYTLEINMDISSSEFRKNIDKNKNMIDSNVFDYIQKNGHYKKR